MNDLPTGPALLALARAVLLDELLPLLPADRRFDARLVANCLAIAEREASAEAARQEEACAAELAMLYGTEDRSADPAIWQRFAGDLRAGAFEDRERDDRLARAILWRLTRAELALANPRFLSANGLPGPVVGA